MSHEQLGPQRLASQQVAQPSSDDPATIVRSMGAIQAQDYLGALWAVGLRTLHASEQTVEQALAEARIVRTWPMRGTIHFVAPEDVRWMLALLTPRIVRLGQTRLRDLAIDAVTLTASEVALGLALEGGRQLTRPELYAELEQAGIATGGQRGIHILGQLSMVGLLCFGARAGKQPTFTLLDEWVSPTPPLSHDEALARLAGRYFTSHGPATLHDFAWWSGLTMADARFGLAAVADQLAESRLDGRSYLAARGLDAGSAASEVFLLPSFDEFLLAYRDRAAVLDPAHADRVVPSSNGLFSPIVVVGGRVVGTWRRELKPGRVVLSYNVFDEFGPLDWQALDEQGARYGCFLNTTVEP